MLSDPNKNQVCLYFFINGQWTPLTTGHLTLNPSQKNFKIDIDKQIDWSLWPDKQPSIPHQTEQTLSFNFCMIRDVQEDARDPKIAYFWYNKEPLAISFLMEERRKILTKILLKQVELGDNAEAIDEFCISDIMNQSHSLITNIFITGNMNMIDSILELIRKSIENIDNLDEKQKDKNFTIIKIAIKVSDRQVLAHLLEGSNYETVLKTLKWNPFNDRIFDYWQEYLQLAIFHNALDFQDKQILNCYEINCRAKFLKDCAACMFTELQTQRNLNNIIVNNYQKIIQKFANNQNFFKQLASLSYKDPETYLNTISEIWVMFQSVCTDVDTILTKDKVWLNFMEYNLHGYILKTVNIILADQNLYKVNSRFHEKWINALNIFLNYDWKKAENWIINVPQNGFTETFLKLFLLANDESLMETILNFIREIITPFQARIQIPSRLYSLIFNKFFSLIWQKMQVRPHTIDQYISHAIKLYKIDPIRTRRMIIQNKILQSLDEVIRRSKLVSICSVKLLECFFVENNQDIFRYMELHNIFKQSLKQEYMRNRWCDNIINGCFRSLKLKLLIYKQKQGLQFISDIIVPSKETDIQQSQ